jgi:hypothetical protein
MLEGKDGIMWTLQLIGPGTNVWSFGAMEAGAQICRLSMNRKALTMAEPKKTRSVPGSVVRRIAVH